MTLKNSAALSEAGISTKSAVYVIPTNEHFPAPCLYVPRESDGENRNKQTRTASRGLHIGKMALKEEADEQFQTGAAAAWRKGPHLTVSRLGRSL